MEDRAEIDKLFNDCQKTDSEDDPVIAVEYNYDAVAFDVSKLEQHKEDIEYYMKYNISSEDMTYPILQIAMLIYAVNRGLPKILANNGFPCPWIIMPLNFFIEKKE